MLKPENESHMRVKMENKEKVHMGDTSSQDNSMGYYSFKKTTLLSQCK